jgi:hypothetical protein
VFHPAPAVKPGLLTRAVPGHPGSTNAGGENDRAVTVCGETAVVVADAVVADAVVPDAVATIGAAADAVVTGPRHPVTRDVRSDM